MYVSRHNIGSLYNNMLLKEMDERVVDYLNENLDELPFGNIFGDDLRIYLPIHKDQTARDILNTLKRIKDYEGLDLQKGEVVRKIKLDPRHGGGDEKEQRMNIGSAISKLKISLEEKKKYLDWLARYKDNIQESLGEQKYGIIITRAPIDVLRMSDHDNIQSCHSATGSYFQCAVQEAINGGVIAYVVNNNELSDEFDAGRGLQDDELFYDEDRNNLGLQPISRLRIRRLADSEGAEFGIPDTRIYGDTTIPGLYETVKAFLHEKQPIDVNDFGKHQWEKRGGTYYDNLMDDLIKKYYDIVGGDWNYPHNASDRSAESHRNYEIKTLTQNLEEECEEITDRCNNRMTFTTVGCDVQIEDDVYILAWGISEFDVSDWGFPELGNINFAIEHDRDDMKKALQGDYDDDMNWSGLLNWIEDKSKLELQGFEFYNNTIKLSYYSENIFFQSDEYDTFCDEVEDYDIKLREQFKTPNDWIEVFVECNILQDETNQGALNKLISNIPDDDLVYSNTSDDRNVEFSLLLDSLKEESFEKYTDPDSIYNTIPFIKDNAYIGDLFGKMLDNYIGQYYKVRPSNTHQQEFKHFVEAYYQVRLMGNNNITKYDITRISVEFDPVVYQGNTSDGSRTIYMNLKFDVESFNEENVDLIIFLYKNLDDLRNMATLAYLSENRHIVTGSPRYKNQFNSLLKVYGKLM